MCTDTSCAHKRLICEQSLVPHGSLHTSCPHDSHCSFLSTSVPAGTQRWMALPLFPHSLLPFLQPHVTPSPVPHCSAPSSSVIRLLRSSICATAYAVGLEQPCANRSASTQCCARLSTASRSGAGPTALLCPQDMLPCPATAFYDSSRSQIALKLLVLRYIW